MPIPRHLRRVIISARRGIFLDELIKNIIKFANENFIELDIKLNLNRQKAISQIYSLSHVISKKFVNGYVEFKVRVSKSKMSQLEHLIK